MKRALVMVGIAVLAVALVGGGIWLRMRSSEVPFEEQPSLGGSLPPPPPPQEDPRQTDPSVGGLIAKTGSLATEIGKSVAGYGFEPDGALVAIQTDGTVVRVLKQEIVSIGKTPFSPLVSASFSFDSRRAILRGEDATSVGIFDVASSSWRALGDLARSSWSPSDLRVVYVAPKGSGWSLFTLDTKSKTAKPQSLSSFSHEGLFPSWIFPDKIFLSEKPSALVDTSVFSFDLAKKILSRIVQGRGALALWDRDASRGIVFVGNARGGGSLALVDSSGNIEKQFSFVTLPSKCAFETKTLGPQAGVKAKKKSWLVCAVPRDRRAFESSILPDAYFQKELRTEDGFYRIDIETGTITTLFDEEASSLDAADVKTKNGRVYFLNQYDNFLYSISLE
ncbi:MAG: hypothetical protein AAB495_03095 [Patescibacteria group bacterium]